MKHPAIAHEQTDKTVFHRDGHVETCYLACGRVPFQEPGALPATGSMLHIPRKRRKTSLGDSYLTTTTSTSNMVLENSSTFLSTQLAISGLILSMTPGQPLRFVSPNLRGWFELSGILPHSYISARPSNLHNHL